MIDSVPRFRPAMKRSTSIQQIDRFIAVDAAGRRHGVVVYAEVVVERRFWWMRRSLRDRTLRLANGTLLERQADGTLVNAARGISLQPLVTPSPPPPAPMRQDAVPA